MKFIDDYCVSSKLLRTALRTEKPDFRMRDTELVLRYFAFRNFLHKYTGNMKPLLDEAASAFNHLMEKRSPIVTQQIDELDLALETTSRIFGVEGAFRKWNGERFERPLNRAIFDVMILHFAQPACAEAAMQIPEQIVDAFKNLCTHDETFRSSVEGTTKTIAAIYQRLRRWGEALRSLVGPAVELVELRDNRIIVPLR
jgi:hypothetical protein